MLAQAKKEITQIAQFVPFNRWHKENHFISVIEEYLRMPEQELNVHFHLNQNRLGCIVSRIKLSNSTSFITQFTKTELK